ncbi:MAG: hypothetical protein KZQ69_15365 [gamma proteobacterium symbiont of Bathyaustriella thionipta]|nr:hypothetical protein [gamma proteobacterium symbiont of Bathyaustriella thionipta]
MNNHPLPNPGQLRQIPPQFSWIDHRLVRDGHFESCSSEALAFYLFLLTVADQKGLSYYSQPSLMKQLKFGTLKFTQARNELIQAKLIAYKHPLYQVLSLAPSSTPESIKQATTSPVHIKKILKQLNAGGHHD